MSTDISIEAVGTDLRSVLDQLPYGESVRLVRPDGTTVAVVVSLRSASGKAPSFDEWEREGRALAEEVSKAWKSEKSALQVLAEMRR